MTTATITNLRGANERVTLPTPLWTGKHPIGTGVNLRAIYRGPRTGRTIIHTDSLWENRLTHRCEGDRWTEVSADEYLHYCNLVDVEPAGVTPANV